MSDPLELFREWFDAAREAGVQFPETMTLATATADGVPSARMVLLKGADEDGFVFFTGYESRKAEELAANPHAALVFYWQPLGRQVRVEGPVERVSERESAEYFAIRARGSQLAAWTSRQSRPLGDRAELERRYAEVEREHENNEVPLPPQWGGFRVRPELVEFWQGRQGRMHDRLVYRREGEGWGTVRLAP
jgi:pyridoxamine 5'-phosphate oxidase